MAPLGCFCALLNTEWFPSFSTPARKRTPPGPTRSLMAKRATVVTPPVANQLFYFSGAEPFSTPEFLALKAGMIQCTSTPAKMSPARATFGIFIPKISVLAPLPAAARHGPVTPVSPPEIHPTDCD